MHLLPLGYPAREPAYGEHHRIHVGGDADEPVQDAAVEIDVGIELALDEKIVGERGMLQLQGYFNQGLPDPSLLISFSQYPFRMRARGS